jgi:3D (Asp-Asp-Asp) domain-containing protein
MSRKAISLLALVSAACSTAGSTWMSQPLSSDDDFAGEGESSDEEGSAGDPMPAPPKPRRRAGGPRQPEARVIGEAPIRRPRTAPIAKAKLEGNVLGTFRNTYYDFPSEGDYKGKPVPLKNAKCDTIKDVPRGFYESVCVQGSGTLVSGQTVSFAKRDCSCAEKCPRTGQQICFDSLDQKQFPYGRGATGQAITPLFTVAVDSSVVPLGTYLYIPEYDGVPRDPDESGLHDGCFMAQDRGLKVKGKHVDVFTADQDMTKLWNQIVPSNQGVTVVLDSPRCARATESAPATAQPSDEPRREKKKKSEEPRREAEKPKSEKTERSESGTRAKSGPGE